MTVREIEIHPGHWKHTGSGANGIINEVTEARKVAKRVYDILKQNNVPVDYFEDNTSSNQRQNLNTLVNYHNKDRDALVVSIHFNSSGATTDRPIGTEVFYYDQKDLAAKVSQAISDATGGELLNRGAKQNKKLAVLARTYEPAILIEVCFVNSSIDVAIYRRDFEKICQAIARELALYLGKTIGNSNQSNNTSKTEEKKDVKPVQKPKTEHKSKQTTYTGNSIVEYLDSIKVDSSFENRKKLAEQHGIKNYKGTAEQNLQLLEILTQGKKVEKSTQVNAKTTATDNRIDTVKEIQAWLNKNYNTRIKEDNIFGSETKKALIKAYQTELNKQFNAKLKVDGIWGQKTKNATRNVRKGAKGNLTRILQATLFCLGYKEVGNIDGIFGQSTEKALKRFQKNKGLKSDAIAGKATWETLLK